MKDEFGKYYEATEPGRRERAYAWATAIGLQDVDGLKPSKYLIKTAKRNIEGEITAAEARRLVDEYCETKINHDVIKQPDVVINVVKDVVKENPLSEAEEKVAKALLGCPKTTAAELATLLKVTPRQAQRVIASLKVKAGLKRRGGRKNGEWYFEKARK